MNSADLEPMTRRLLEATRDLTMSFAQWSMGKASEDEVSDRYVKLGNEYVLARNRLAHSGIPANDLPDVPAELRQILEQALAQEPSKAVHSAYEPRLKAVMAQLFRLLKFKQLQLAPSNSQMPNGSGGSGVSQQETFQPPHQTVGPAHGSAHADPSASHSYGHAQGAFQGAPPAAATQHYPQAQDSASHAPRRVSPADRHAVVQNAPTSAAPPTAQGQAQPFRAAHMPVRPPPNYRQGSAYADKAPNGLPRQRLAVPDDALSQLQNHGALERQASKRYSSHQLAQIINGSPSEKSSLPTTGVHKTSAAPDFTAHNVVRRPETAAEPPPQTPEQSIHRRASMRQRQGSLPSQHSANNSVASQSQMVSPVAESELAQIPVFLRLDNRVRKVLLDQPPSLGAIRLRFVDVYEYIHSGANSFPEIVMLDDKSGIEYELNESTVGDVVEGTLLTLKVKSTQEQTLESEILALRESVKEIAAKLDSKPDSGLTRGAGAGTPAPTRSYASPVLTGDGRFKLDKPISKHASRDGSPRDASPRDAPHDRAEQLSKEIAAIRQTANKTVSAMRAEIVALREDLNELREAKVTSDVAYMSEMKDRLDIESQRLVVRIEDLSDIIDHQRVNVADRGVLYTPQELNNVRRELANLTSEFEEVEAFLRNEKPVLSKTWEASLNNIISWQEWYKNQEALVRDLRHDIDQCLSVVDLVKEANEKRRQKQLQNPHLRQLPPAVAPPLTKDEEKAATTAVLAEISALNLDHDQRAEAMKRAERLRRTELALRPDEFADELSQFVSDAKLKENGGYRELERLVEERERKARASGEESEVLAKQNAEAIKEQRRKERELRRAQEKE